MSYARYKHSCQFFSGKDVFGKPKTDYIGYKYQFYICIQTINWAIHIIWKLLSNPYFYSILVFFYIFIEQLLFVTIIMFPMRIFQYNNNFFCIVWQIYNNQFYFSFRGKGGWCMIQSILGWVLTNRITCNLSFLTHWRQILLISVPFLTFT